MCEESSLTGCEAVHVCQQGVHVADDGVWQLLGSHVGLREVLLVLLCGDVNCEASIAEERLRYGHDLHTVQSLKRGRCFFAVAT